MKRSIKIGALAIAGAAAAALVVAPAPAGASTSNPFAYLAGAGATRLEAADGVVISDTTAPSTIYGYQLPGHGQNDIASAGISGLLSAGAATSSVDATAINGGGELVSHAEIANLNLLNGAVTIDAVKTTTTSTIVNHVMSADSATTFAGIHIAGVDLPINIPKNFAVTIPGVAQLVLNLQYTVTDNGTIATQGGGLYLSLLQPQGDIPQGAQLFLTPTYQVIQEHAPHTPFVLGGQAYGTHLTVHGGDIIGIDSGPTALQSLAAGGTGGKTVTNSTAGVNIPDVLTTGVIKTQVRGSTSKTVADAFTSAQTAGVNLFDGLITAKALTVTARAHRSSDGTITYSRSSTLVGLKIAGQKIPIDAAPNTTIDVAGLGTVVINQQATVGPTTGVRALDITLDTARAGLPLGAEIEVSAATASIIS